jgi:hypothetical protein
VIKVVLPELAKYLSAHDFCGNELPGQTVGDVIAPHLRGDAAYLRIYMIMSSETVVKPLARPALTPQSSSNHQGC